MRTLYYGIDDLNDKNGYSEDAHINTLRKQPHYFYGFFKMNCYP